MRLVFLAAVATWMALGCASDTSKASYLDRCEQQSDCEAELSCKLGRCTKHCNLSTMDAEGVCAELDAICLATGCFPACSGGAQCPKELGCFATSQANVQACQPYPDDIPDNFDPAGNDFGNAGLDAGP